MQKLLVINALKKQYYKDCHILGSINVPLEELDKYLKDIDKETHIVVYCGSYHCPISHKAWHIVRDLGFKNVWAYEGGMAEWVQKGYLVQGACQEEYLNRQETAEVRDVATMSAEELKEKMEKAGLLTQ